ncbi:MAG: peptidylprolyl isomerase [Planctomycetes bacterium]|nr:peptidylprolyl isomerase [Planctomycetota bacterium]
MQTISKGKIVSIHYTLRGDDGVVIDSSEGGTPLDYLHGAGNIVPGLEKGLDGHAVGEKLEVKVAPADGYGVHDPRGVQRVPRQAFPEDVDLEPGMQFGAEDPQGDSTTVWIVKVEDEQVVIDMNHPLAGKTLHFAISIAAVRDATKEEVAHGHPHGPHGHHHH